MKNLQFQERVHFASTHRSSHIVANKFWGGMKNIICALLFICWHAEVFSYTIPRNTNHNWLAQPYDDSYDEKLRETNVALKNYNTSVLFYLYTKSTIDKPQQLWKDDLTALSESDFDRTRKTIIVSHGYMDSYTSDISQKIKNALLAFEDDNVIAIDWSHYTKNVIYSWVVAQVSGVGNYVGQFANFLVDQGLNPDKTHLLGHSLGAHVSGFAGKELSSNGHKVARVTGLDPALPGFDGDDPGSRLSSTDGDFVDCIHTCAGLLGYDLAICQADFYPNGGENIQPGCGWWDFGVCSHGRSFEYFAESINKSHHFYSETCNAIVAGVPYGCANNGAVMGYYADDRILGKFYLTTRSKYPYALNISSFHSF